MATIREEKQISAYRLAQLVDTTTSHIARIERGECSPSVDLALAIARELKTPVEELFLEKIP